MVSVAFVVHPDRPEAAELAARASQWLTDHGHKAGPVIGDMDHSHDDGTVPARTRRGARQGLDLGAVDMAVSLGGDGTMLRTVSLTAPLGIPVLGVNLGHLGYLTEVEPTRLEDALERFASGRYRIEERMTLDVRVDRAAARAPVDVDASGESGESEEQHDDIGADESFLVLNEAAVERTLPGHTIRVAVQIEGRPFVTYAADGLLVATPTGSTAYNLSVRGPIVSPQMEAIVLTPISPHMLFDRALILAPDEWLRLEVVAPRPALLVIDGEHVDDLVPGDALTCRPGRSPARFVTFGGRDFHAILRARFHLYDR
jgi:NAD+ kinase